MEELRSFLRKQKLRGMVILLLLAGSGMILQTPQNNKIRKLNRQVR